jgi:hypothetical protein
VLYEGVSELLILSWIVLGTAVCELLTMLLLRQDRQSFHYSELEKNPHPYFLESTAHNPHVPCGPFPQDLPRNIYVTLATR